MLRPDRLILQTCFECDSIHRVEEGELFICELCGYEHLGQAAADDLSVLANALKLTERQAVCLRAHRGSMLTSGVTPCRRGRVVGCAEHYLWACTLLK